MYFVLGCFLFRRDATVFMTEILTDLDVLNVGHFLARCHDRRFGKFGQGLNQDCRYCSRFIEGRWLQCACNLRGRCGYGRNDVSTGGKAILRNGRASEEIFTWSAPRLVVAWDRGKTGGLHYSLLESTRIGRLSEGSIGAFRPFLKR